MWHYFSIPFSITLDTQKEPIPIPRLQSFAYVAQTFFSSIKKFELNYITCLLGFPPSNTPQMAAVPSSSLASPLFPLQLTVSFSLWLHIWL